MRAYLIRLFILPQGITWLVSLSLFGLILSHAPLPLLQAQAQSDRNDFPGQRRGGGTHWTVNSDCVA